MTESSLLITVDVEGLVEEGSFESVRTLETFLETLGLPATLFVTPAVVSARPDTVAAWVEAGHSVGLHVHPARFGGDSDWLETYEQFEIEEFLTRGRTVFEDSIGHEPMLFRAGRWSFSHTVLAALDATGFDVDASHRPGGRRDPYAHGGVAEYPMTVVGNPLLELLLRPTGIDGMPLHADAFLQTRPRAVALYAATAIAMRTTRPYVMVSLHDYDLSAPRVRNRIMRYLARLAEWRRPTTLGDLNREAKTLSN